MTPKNVLIGIGCSEADDNIPIGFVWKDVRGKWEVDGNDGGVVDNDGGVSRNDGGVDGEHGRVELSEVLSIVDNYLASLALLYASWLQK